MSFCSEEGIRSSVGWKVVYFPVVSSKPSTALSLRCAYSGCGLSQAAKQMRCYYNLLQLCYVLVAVLDAATCILRVFKSAPKIISPLPTMLWSKRQACALAEQLDAVL